MKCTAENQPFGFGFIAIFTVFITILCLSSASSQELKPTTADIKPNSEATICKGSHSTRDFYKNARVNPPSTILEILGNRVNYATAHEGIELGSFDLEQGYSVVPKDFTAKNHQGCYGIIYCEKHLVILNIDEVDSKHCQLSKG